MDANLLDPASWHKLPQPLFSTNEALGRYGPGHNSFTLADDGQVDIMVYHARDYKELQGTPLIDPNRHTSVAWNGLPKDSRILGRISAIKN